MANTAGTGSQACIPRLYGCVKVLANNYNATANTDDGTCTYSAMILEGGMIRFHPGALSHRPLLPPKPAPELAWPHPPRSLTPPPPRRRGGRADQLHAVPGADGVQLRRPVLERLLPADRRRQPRLVPLPGRDRDHRERWRESRLTAAIPIDNPDCSCKLTRVRSRQIPLLGLICGMTLLAGRSVPRPSWRHLPPLPVQSPASLTPTGPGCAGSATRRRRRRL